MVVPPPEILWPLHHGQLLLCVGGQAGPPPAGGWEVLWRSAEQIPSLPHPGLSLNSVEGNKCIFRGLDFIFVMSVLGQNESCSSLGRQRRSKESPGTAIHVIKANTVAKEPQPTLLYLPGLMHLQGVL